MQISFSTVWGSLISFVKQPRLDPLPNTFLESPQKVFIYLLGLDFLLMFPLSGIMGLAGVEEMDHKVMEMMDNPLALALMAVIAAPILEEFFFRFPIGNWWKVSEVFFGKSMEGSAIVQWWSRNLKTIFWVFTIIFATIHLTNFGASISIFLAPLLVLPQFILGIMLGYIRIGWGFRYSILFHALHNGILVGLATLGGELGAG